MLDKKSSQPDAKQVTAGERVTSVKHWTDRLFSFRIERPQSFRFRSGDFVMIGLQGEGEKPLLRAYSVASPSWDDELEFYSIKVQDGPLTSRLQHIKVGDQITLGPHTGMVRHIGLTQLHLRTPEGSVFLPNRLLAGEALSIGRSRNSYPLRARLTAARAWPPQALEAARCVAMLSPYRDVNSRVNVHCEAEDGRALIVELQVWSPRLLDAADKHLRTMLEENLRSMVSDDDRD